MTRSSDPRVIEILRELEAACEGMADMIEAGTLPDDGSPERRWNPT